MAMIDQQSLDAFKTAQKQSWASFAPLEAFTTPPAARLVKFARIEPGLRVLDVACGTGVVAVTAAFQGAKVTGLDLTPELLERARENSRTGGVDIDWREGDVEALPFPDATFDAVLSQFGHMFAPRPDVATREVLRVLRPGGTLAFSTWPPELFTGRSFELLARYLPPPPASVSPPVQWGDPHIVRERLGAAVKDLRFEREAIFFPTLSPVHALRFRERTSAPVMRLVAALESSDPARLESFRREYEALTAEYFEDNSVRQGYLMTRAVKV